MWSLLRLTSLSLGLCLYFPAELSLLCTTLIRTTQSDMISSTPAGHDSLAFNSPNTFAVAQGSVQTPSIECDSFAGVPLLPAASSWQCGTKTNNTSLMSTCCNGAKVEQYLGCFMHCAMEDINMIGMQDFVACLSIGGNSTALGNVSGVDRNAFCQGGLNGTVEATSYGVITRSRSKGLRFIFSVIFVALLFCELAAAECAVSVEESALIRQGEARRISTGSSCGSGSSYCVVDQTGTDEIPAANRTVGGRDASGDDYDDFFQALGESTDPPRLFAAKSSIQVRQWAVGVADASMINWSSWVPFMVSDRIFLRPAELDPC